MRSDPLKPVYGQVLIEENQEHDTRQALFGELEKKLERPVITFFTSFTIDVSIEDADADIIAGLLEKMDLSKGLALIISSAICSN